jgi:hypothetical protein
MNINDKETIIKLLDKALVSNSNEVKEILQSLLITVALIHSDDKLKDGPLTKLFNDNYHLEKRLDAVESNIRRLEKEIINNTKNENRTKTNKIYHEDTTWKDRNNPTLENNLWNEIIDYHNNQQLKKSG